jgi:hypothetical protein
MDKKEEKTSTIAPSNFRSVIIDFTNDLTNTFPEYAFLWSKWCDKNISEQEIQNLFEFCITTYPERFFDILYQNENIFSTETGINTQFLPNVDFKVLFSCSDISNQTKKAIWKYLQLILFTIVGEVKDKNNFGESANLFDGIDENELHTKLNETISSISDFFSNIGSSSDKETDSTKKQGGDFHETSEKDESFKMPNPEDFSKSFDFKDFASKMPNMENIQDNLKNLFEGKIGSLAKEMAEEISGEFQDLLGEDMNDIRNTSDVMKKLMKDPKKIMGLMKKIGSKLDTKLNSGEISREEIMKEATSLFGKMKEMGGNDDMNEMFKNLAKGMGMGGLGKNMRMDTNALERMTKQQEMRERMRRKMEMKKQEKPAAGYKIDSTNNPNNLVFKLDGEDVQEKSFIHPDILKEIETQQEQEKIKKTTDASKSNNNNKKKKKNKGKK